MRSWWRAVALLTVLGVLAGGAAAWADGDPASDVLLSQVAFLPADGGFSHAQQARLTGLLRAAALANGPVRVAVIPNSYDLGSITALWHKPETYARFLGAELSLVFKHPLVVVMPNGVGLNWPGHSVAAADRALAGLRVSPGPAGLLSAATAGVRRVLSAEHVHVSVSAQKPASAAKPSGQAAGAVASRSGGSGSAALVVTALAAALVVAALIAYRVLGPRHRRVRQGPPPAPPADSSSARSRVRWMVPAGIAAVVVAVGVPILVVALVRGSPAGARSDAASKGTPYTLAEGRQRAPNFTLHDQNGRSISPSDFHGRDVLITFVDPLCRNLCPLEAHVLNALVDRLPVAQRPAIIAVSVDTYADTRHDLLQDFRKWDLVPQWHWAVGTHAQLASVWKGYGADVQVVTKHLAGTTVHYITHTEASYLIDRSGYERALFAWPFTAQNVLSTLRRLSGT